jgi:hypothetical protein
VDEAPLGPALAGLVELDPLAPVLRASMAGAVPGLPATSPLLAAVLAPLEPHAAAHSAVAMNK